jgi:hypothetical protein
MNGTACTAGRGPGSLPHRLPGQNAGQRLEIPAAVRALHGTDVSLRGYMLPLDAGGTGVGLFVLTASIDSCHWGIMGLPNEWVLVRMAGGARVPFKQFQPFTVFGRFSVAPQWAAGQLTGLYELTGTMISAGGL